MILTFAFLTGVVLGFLCGRKFYWDCFKDACERDPALHEAFLNHTKREVKKYDK